MPSTENRWRKWLASALPVLAFAAAYFIFSPQGRDLIDRMTVTDASIRASFEATLRESKTYQALKEHYPEIYEELIAGAVNDVRTGVSSDQTMAKSAEITAKLRQREARYYAMASTESLRQSLVSQVSTLAHLKTTYGFKACNTLAVYGGQALMKLLGPQAVKDLALRRLIDESSGLFFQIVVEGRKLGREYEQPTDADWQLVVDHLTSKGMPEADLAIVAESEKHLDNPLLCDLAINFNKYLATMQGDAADRVIPYLAATMAAG